MKGFFVKAIEKLVVDETGLMQRETLLHKAGFSPNELFIIRTDVDDAKVKKMVNTALKLLDTEQDIFIEKYGSFWVNEYASVIFKQIFNNSKTSKDFIRELFTIHAQESSEKSVKVSDKLTAEFPDDKTMIIHYKDKLLLSLIEAIIVNLTKKYEESPKIETTEGKYINIVY